MRKLFVLDRNAWYNDSPNQKVIKKNTARDISSSSIKLLIFKAQGC